LKVYVIHGKQFAEAAGQALGGDRRRKIHEDSESSIVGNSLAETVWWLEPKFDAKSAALEGFEVFTFL
jgi:hypothetical protein